ncbi:hypothetical protein [Microbacterium oxydans]|uniref:hypothetical protein n=1 Tax=Microbacterium oxydans TaxID=82380 RepID=UPI0022B2003B|nr:hypothetical protein [Microbacterium oxydans]MCZ4301338.1 hypothetical protein [Microbacterium oxydans]
MSKSQLQRLAMEKAQAYAPRTTPDPGRRAQASRNLAEAKIAAAIERNLAEAPPLTPSQVKRLSGLLRTGGVK